MDEQRAFDGIKVLDFTQGIAGPHSTMLLAQHGADVIKIDPLDGDWGRSMGALYGDHCAHSIAFNRGKRSIALDMKQPEALEVTQKMAAECDVVVEAFRPGVMAKFGSDREQITEVLAKVKKSTIDALKLERSTRNSKGPERAQPEDNEEEIVTLGEFNVVVERVDDKLSKARYSSQVCSY